MTERRSAGRTGPWRSSRLRAPRRPDTHELDRRPLTDRCRAACIAGTSGFAYPGWVPRFYPLARARQGYLRHYAGARRRRAEQHLLRVADGDRRSRPGSPQRRPTSASRSRPSAAARSARSQVDPAESVAWLTGPYRAFGERLGTVLFRVPDDVQRDDAKLAGLLAAWPSDLPLHDGVPGSVVARRRDVRRHSPVSVPRCARPSCRRTPNRRSSAGRARSCTSVSDGTTTPTRS